MGQRLNAIEKTENRKISEQAQAQIDAGKRHRQYSGLPKVAADTEKAALRACSAVEIFRRKRPWL
jgi:hypothetical protein